MGSPMLGPYATGRGQAGGWYRPGCAAESGHRLTPGPYNVNCNPSAAQT